MNKHSPLLGLFLLQALAADAKQRQSEFTPRPEPSRPKPVERKPLSRKLECPDCGQEVLLVRSTTSEDGESALRLHGDAARIAISEDLRHLIGVALEYELA